MSAGSMSSGAASSGLTRRPERVWMKGPGSSTPLILVHSYDAHVGAHRRPPRRAAAGGVSSARGAGDPDRLAERGHDPAPHGAAGVADHDAVLAAEALGGVEPHHHLAAA